MDKVLVTFQGYGGVQRHRIHDPFQHIHKNRLADIQHTPSLDNLDDDSIKALEAFDVVVFNRNISGVFNPQEVYDSLRKAGVKIIVDLDDFWELPKSHVAYPLYQKTNLTAAMLWQIRNADMVWVTHERLGRAVSEYNRNWYVIPNGIDPDTLPTDDNVYTDKVFYQGSVTHRTDLELIKDMDITICGNVDDDGEWAKIRKMMPNATFEDAKTADKYHELYYDKGICVIPLKQNKFNQMKSNLKMIEAGWYKKPVVVAGIHPYVPFARHKENAMVVKRGKYDANLKELQASKTLQDDIRLQLHEDILEHHMMEDINRKRVELIAAVKDEMRIL